MQRCFFLLSPRFFSLAGRTGDDLSGSKPQGDPRRFRALRSCPGSASGTVRSEQPGPHPARRCRLRAYTQPSGLRQPSCRLFWGVVGEAQSEGAGKPRTTYRPCLSDPVSAAGPGSQCPFVEAVVNASTSPLSLKSSAFPQPQRCSTRSPSSQTSASMARAKSSNTHSPAVSTPARATPLRRNPSARPSAA